MNIILADKSEIQDGSLIVTDRRAEHLVKVLKIKVDDTVRIGQINGPMGKGRVLEVRVQYPFSVKLEVVFDVWPQAVQGIDLVLALPRPIMLKRILSQMSAMGVGTIHLVNANRVEKSFWKATILNESEYMDHLLQGLEQAVDTRVPQICIHNRFKPFVEDYLPTILDSYPVKIVAHPKGPYTLASQMRAGLSPVLLAVGPEGGWVDYEVEKFCQLGFSSCSLGDRILKVDTATIALHARITVMQELASSV